MKRRVRTIEDHGLSASSTGEEEGIEFSVSFVGLRFFEGPVSETAVLVVDACRRMTAVRNHPLHVGAECLHISN